jgi:hypothetical protein
MSLFLGLWLIYPAARYARRESALPRPGYEAGIWFKQVQRYWRGLNCASSYSMPTTCKTQQAPRSSHPSFRSGETAYSRRDAFEKWMRIVAVKPGKKRE